MKKLLLLIFSCTLAPLGAITLNNFFTESNDRFANNSRFIADGFDLSGVGRTGGGAWGILLSRNVFISAVHFRPSDTSSLTFYKTNDPNGESVTIGVKDGAGMQIERTDIWLGVLDHPVPSDYAFYDFASEEISNSETFHLSPYANEVAYIFGRSPTDFPITQDVVVGRNVLDGFETFPVTEYIGCGVTATIGGENAVTHEATLVRGDSGGPMFVSLQTGQLTLVGVNWYVMNDETTHETTFNGFTYTGNYDKIIRTFIDTNWIPGPLTFAAAYRRSVCRFVLHFFCRHQ